MIQKKKEYKDYKKNNKKEVKIEEVKEETKKEEVKTVKEDLSAKTLTELKAMAKDAGVKGYSTMKKEELINSLK